MHINPDYVWQSNQARQTRVVDMTNEHLVNTINWLERHMDAPWDFPTEEQRTVGYFHLRTEAMRRGLRWRRFSHVALWDGELSQFPPKRNRVLQAIREGRFFGRRGEQDIDKTFFRHQRGHTIPMGGPGAHAGVGSNPVKPTLLMVKLGGRFLHDHTEFMRVKPTGIIRNGLMGQGYSYHTDGYLIRGPDDGIIRCLVVRMSDGLTFVLPGSTVVERL